MLTQETKAALEQAVEKGASTLDAHQPDWFKKINLIKLDIAHDDLCICGQLSLWATDLEDHLYPGHEHGIYPIASSVDAGWDVHCTELTKLWTKAILHRRKGATQCTQPN